jgi:PAS domain S-box-containing protein
MPLPPKTRATAGLSSQLPQLQELALEAANEGITISDLRQPDDPIVYANRGFARLTGYEMDETIGRNCRFLQGPDTDPATIQRLREALDRRVPCSVDILNYRKDGTPFWNRLSITPVENDEGELTHYVGVQSDITARKRVEEKLARANQRMSRSLEAAAAIQRSLLPESMPDIPGIEFAWAFEPCYELAGDSLDVFRIDDEHVALYVLDVVGHGVPAALLSVTLSQVLSFLRRSSALSGSGSFADSRLVSSPKAAVERLNQLFPMRQESRQYFTLFFGVLHLPSRTLRYVTAGHPAPVRSPAEGPCDYLPVGGFPVGMTREPEYREREARLSPGDRLFIYTDGLLEAENPEGREFGAERLSAEIRRRRQLPLADSVEALEATAKRWAGGRLADDLSILALEIGADQRSA